MKNIKASTVQGILSVLLFNFGSSVIIGISSKLDQDTWVAIITAAILAVPLFLIYARLIRLFPEKDMFEMAEIIFGRFIGKLFTLLMIVYAVALAALVLRDFSEFTEISALYRTPKAAIVILMAMATTYLARSGMGALGKWSIISCGFVLLAVLLTFAAAIPEMKPDMLQPYLSHSFKEFAEVTVDIFAFPYAETVIFLCVASTLSKEANPYTVFLVALLLTMLVFLMVVLRNLAVLGTKLMELSYFPSYVTVRIIAVGNLISRAEGLISSNFFFAGIVKIAACIMAAGRGLGQLFDRADEGRVFIIPVGIVSAVISIVIYQNIMEMFSAIDKYPLHAMPFQLIIPLTVWIGGEIYSRRSKNKKAAGEKGLSET